jgi:hypothetical protein
MTNSEMKKQEAEFDSTLIGLPIEEAYNKIIAKGLKTNWSRSKDGGMIEYTGPRILLFIQSYITVSCDDLGCVRKTRRG